MPSIFDQMMQHQRPGKGKVVVGSSQEEEKKKHKKGVIVTASVFFDGTGNNRNNTSQRLLAQGKPGALPGATPTGSYRRNGQTPISGGNSYGNYYSNVAILELMNLQKRQANREISLYLEGIGTTDDGGDDLQGSGFGAGDTGVVKRVTVASTPAPKGNPNEEKSVVNQVRKAYKPKTEYIEKLHINVFGFSRGAAAARHFVAQRDVICRHLGLAPTLVHYTFVGLFDSVSSHEPNGRFGLLGGVLEHDFHNDFRELGLVLRPRAHQIRKVVHLVAANEYRENFALTTIDSTIRAGAGYELVLPGAHSDVGGGYGERETERRQVRPEEEKELLAEGWYGPEQLDRFSESGTRTLPYYYQFIPLALMLRLATNYGMEFKSFSEQRFRLFTVPATHARLRQIGAQLLAAGLAADGARRKELTLPSVELHFLRKHYLHRSHSNETGMGASLIQGRLRRFLIRC